MSDLPVGWEVKYISEIADVKGGKRLPKGYSLQDKKNNYPYIRVTDMYDGGVNLDSIMYVPEEVAPFISKYTISTTDIFITVAGTLGLVGKIPSSLDNANLTENADKITSIKVEQDFLLEVLRSPLVQRHIEAEKTQNAQPKLALTRIKKFQIPLPPLPEQRKIAQILSTWDKAIATTEKQITNSKQQKKALMQQLLTGKKRLAGFSGDWVGKKISDFFLVCSSKRVLQSEWKDTGIPFYRTRELVSLSKNEKFGSEIFISNELYQSLKKKYGIPKAGDILVSGVGTLGVSYLIVKDNDFYFKDGNVLWLKKDKEINSVFFNYSFHSSFVQRQILNQTTITTVGTYTISNAKKTKFLCPPTIEEQQKIAQVLTTVDNEISTLETQLTHLQQEKKALMQQLLTGKRRVKI